MRSGPSKTAEALVAMLIPSACREEVLGDLHERYRSPVQYGFDALRTVPLVIASRICRTSDVQVLIIQACLVYASFLLQDHSGALRAVVPAVVAALALMLSDAYARPGRRSPLELMRGPAAAIALGALAQIVIGQRVAWSAYAVAFVLLCAIRLLFIPQPTRAHAGHAAGIMLLVCTACGLLMGAAVHPARDVLTYSQFMHDVHAGRVTSVIVFAKTSGAVEASCTLKGGETARTVLPPHYEDALRAMEATTVNVEIRDASAEPQMLVLKAAPFLVLLFVWGLLLVWRPFAHR